MFAHIFINRLKCVFRDRQTVFWSFLFPLILATLFGMAFSNLNKGEAFDTIDLAIVNTAQYRSDTTLQTALTSMSSQSSTQKPMFALKLVESEEAANDILKNNEITGYILYTEDAPRVVVKESGMNQTILKEFIDHYLQMKSAYTKILMENPNALQGFNAETTNVERLIEEVSPTDAAPNNTLTYYFALIAMACLYGGFWGMKEVSAVQANQSPQGARINLAPVHKLKVFGYSLCVVILMQFLAILVLIAYLHFVMKVDFGNQVGYMLLASLAGCTMGVSFGAFVGAVLKNNEGLKVAVLIGTSMFFSFFAGLMVADMKYIVTEAVPALAYINPANLVADAFYSLYYYTTHTRFFTNIGLLFGISVVLFLVVYFVMRRQRYASI